MKKYKYFTIILIFAFISFSAKGKTNYNTIITNNLNNDTIVKLKEQISSLKEIKVYDKKEIKEFVIEKDRHFLLKAIQIENKIDTVFLERLMDGIVDLYIYKINNNSLYYIEKGEKIHKVLDISEIKSNNYKVNKKNTLKYQSLLAYIFEDYPELSENVKNFNLSEKSLIYFIKKYNKDVYNHKPVLHKGIKNNVFFEFNSCIDNYSFIIGNTTHSRYYTSPLAGINFKFYSFKNKNIGITLGANYKKIKLKDEFVNERYFYSVYEYDLNASLLSIPLCIEYSSHLNRNQIYLALGLNNVLRLNSKSEIQKYNSNIDAIKRYSTGFIFKSGLSFKIKESSYFFTELSFTNIQPFPDKNPENDFNINSLIFKFGYGFGIK